MTISFDEDAVWNSKVTAIRVGDTVLDDGQYTITNGQLTIKEGVIQTPGNYTITVEATGYQDASVVQTVNVGEFSTVQSTAVLSPDPEDWVYLPDTNELKLTAKDQYGNTIQGYLFKAKVKIVNQENSDVIMDVDGTSYTCPANQTMVFPVVNLASATDEDGDVTVHFAVQPGQYSYRLDIFLNDGETMFW
nr:DUF1533 domain-containing protein [Brevibacillus nitrificans]